MNDVIVNILDAISQSSHSKTYMYIYVNYYNVISMKTDKYHIGSISYVP